MKFNLLILIGILCLVSLASVGAVECNADLSQGGDSCTVSSSLTLNGSYVVNMSGSINLGSAPLINSPATMIRYYKFNNDSSVGENYTGATTTVVDYIGNLNASAITSLSANWNVTGGFLGDGAFEFKKSASRITMASVTTINTSITGYTINLWAKQTIDADNTLFGDNDANNDYVRLKGDTNRILIEFSSTGTNYNLVYSGITETNFNMYTFSFLKNEEDDNSTITLYVNGVYQSNATYVQDVLNINRIGDGYGGTTTAQYFNGTIDDFIVYNSSLTDDEVTFLYNHYLLDGAIILNGNNINFDCNGSTISGLNISGSKGINAKSFSNLTLSNCIFTNYSYGLFLEGTYNFTLKNSIISNNSIYGLITSLIDTLIIQNTTFSNEDSISLRGNNVLFEDNTVIGTYKITSKNIYGRGNNYLFRNNDISRGEYGADFSSVIGLNITGNNFNNNDRALEVRGYSDEIQIVNNTFYNNSGDFDLYDLDVWIVTRTNNALINISGNLFNESTSTAIFAQWTNTSRFFIENNIFDFVPMNLRSNYKARDTCWTPSAILLTPTYKSFLQGGDNNANRIASISKKENFNVTIRGNTFLDIDLMLLSQGTEYLQHDLANYKLVSFQAPTDYFSRSDYYIKSSFNNLSRYPGSGIVNDTLCIAYYSNGKVLFNHKINKDFLWFSNVNTTVNPDISKNLTIFQQTSALISLSNGTGYIANGNVNITLSPKNYTYVLDNFNSGQDFGLLSSLIGVEDATALYNQLNYTIPIMVWLKLNEANGTIAHDSSGNTNHGVISGATWQTDGITRTLINGVDYVLVTSSGLLTLSSDYLYSWVGASWVSTGVSEDMAYGLRILGQEGLMGWLPAIIALIIGIFLLAYFGFGKGDRTGY